jgi:hypothetical protein
MALDGCVVYEVASVKCDVVLSDFRGWWTVTRRLTVLTESVQGSPPPLLPAVYTIIHATLHSYNPCR